MQSWKWRLTLAFGLVLVGPAHAQDDGEGSAQVETSASADQLDSSTPEANSSEDEEIDDEFQSVQFGRELRTVEEDVNHLKERVFRSKATLQLLKELVIEGATVGSRVAVWHVNRLGGSYSMEAVKYFLNGKNVFTKVDPGGTLDTVRELKVHEQTVPPGTHNLQMSMVLRGKGYQIFSYLRTYQFNVQSSYSFRVEDGRLTLVRVIAESSGGLKNFVERPTVSYDERSESLREE
jgi:hypothetical protein